MWKTGIFYFFRAILLMRGYEFFYDLRIIMQDLMTIDEASVWAADFLKRDITASNISYLIQYGRINKCGDNGRTLVSISDLRNYYESQLKPKEETWKNHLGKDLNWSLSFDEYKESERTKHVHRLHPYKGKFIP
ncbi:MAG: hypothetical protein AB7S75_22205 [Desulfococcaceae bacterium]